MNNNNNLKMNFIPRGNFDKNIYSSFYRKDVGSPSSNKYIDDSVQTTKFLGHFKDNFSVIDDKDINNIDSQGTFMGNYTLRAFPLLYSRQVFQPIFENKNIETNNISHGMDYFKLGDPMVGGHGSNINAPGSNLHIHPFNAIDLYKNDIYTKIKNSDINPVSRLEKNN